MSNHERLENQILRESKDVASWVLDANSVVFGAILSAYAGVKISQLDDNFVNASLIFGICILHVMFLFSSIVFSVKRSGMRLETKISYALLVLSTMFVASSLWKTTFTDHYIYISILAGWFITQYVLAGGVVSITRKMLDGLR